jgi:glutamine cyclotransferase
MKLLYTLGFVLIFTACKNDKDDAEETKPSTPSNEPANISYTVSNVYPHDTASFTQGLEWHNGFLYEGTGMKGESKLLRVNLKDGKAVQQMTLPAEFFGEGITIFNNKIYQLTWQEHKIFVYDVKTFKKEKEFSWDYEGWGITNDGKHLIISTGSNSLYFVDPASMKILKTVGVFSNYGPLGEINELEYVNGKVYANIWNSEYIAVINPESGAVEARIDFTGILQKFNKDTYPERDVLNGIAYDSTTRTFYITGKRWPALFEIKLNG